MPKFSTAQAPSSLSDFCALRCGHGDWIGSGAAGGVTVSNAGKRRVAGAQGRHGKPRAGPTRHETGGAGQALCPIHARIMLFKRLQL